VNKFDSFVSLGLSKIVDFEAEKSKKDAHVDNYKGRVCKLDFLALKPNLLPTLQGGRFLSQKVKKPSVL